MHNNNTITRWIRQTIESSRHDWIVLTLRIDGVLKNTYGATQSPWNPSVLGSLSKIETALEWALGMLRRRLGKKIQFVAYHGGDYGKGIYPHIHAIAEVPAGVEPAAVVEFLQKYWQQSVDRKFKSYLKTSIHQEDLISSQKYLRYISRYEGETFGSGDSKLVLNRSFIFYTDSTSYFP